MIHNDRPRSTDVFPGAHERPMVLGRSNPYKDIQRQAKPDCSDEPPCRCVDVRPCPDMPHKKPVCVEMWTCTCENQDPPSCSCESDFSSF